MSINRNLSIFSQNLTSSNTAISNAVAAGTTVINYDPRNGTTGNLQPVLTKGDLVTLDGGITVYAVDSSNANTITIQTATTVAYSAGSVITRYWKYYNQFEPTRTVEINNPGSKAQMPKRVAYMIWQLSPDMPWIDYA